VTPAAYALLGLTALVGALGAAMGFAVLRAAGAARNTRRRRGAALETTELLTTIEDAVGKLKTQERAASARAEATERLNDEIISSITAGLLVIGLDGMVRILNPAARRMLQVPETAPLDHHRRLLREPALSDVIDECLTTRGVVPRRTVELPEGSHGPSHLGITVSPLFDHQGDLHGAVCLFTDLTSIKRLEEQLRLKESLATVGELTAGIAHEFRNGLATIHGYSKLLALDCLPEAYHPYVDGIRGEAESLGQVVTNFLNFARPAQLVFAPVDLRAVCERAAGELRSEALALGAEIDVRGQFGTVDGDEVLLRQAFSNLLRNAVEACSSSVTPMVIVEAAIDTEQNLLYVAVEDNGPGIPPDARDRVFRPFFTSKRGGTGLGLALVQKIIVLHNGRIHAGSSPLGGASFQIALPIGR
jgi:signal transduction histidine kinase